MTFLLRFLPPCREVTEAVARGEMDDAPLLRRLAVSLHLALCGLCARYARQLRLLGQAARLRASRLDIARVEALQNRILARLLA